ncbi:MAG: hypothetical protein KAG53_07375, partial [Endozoicomonadaceae bacterium]|nr:hypothetical protein [Endozoicomonadaceae bacterium]
MNSLTEVKNILFKRTSTNPIVKSTSSRASSSNPALPISDELDGSAVVSGVGVVRSVSHVGKNDAASDTASDVASSYCSTSDDELASSESSHIVWRQAKKITKKLKLRVKSKSAKAKAALKAEQ